MALLHLKTPRFSWVRKNRVHLIVIDYSLLVLPAYLLTTFPEFFL